MVKKILKTNQNHPAVKAYKEAVRKGMESQHVLPREGKWAVKKAGSSKASGIFDNKAEAVSFAKEVAINQGTALFIHGKDGRIQDRLYQ